MAALFLFVLFIILVSTIFWVFAIVDIVRRDFTDPNMKIVWLIVVIFSHWIGSILYYAIGRQQGVIRG
jgi:hypothetical protein